MLTNIKSFFEKQDRFARLLGFEIVEVREGYARIRTQTREDYLNGADVLHGGFLFALADYAFAVASNAANNLSLAIQANILYHKAVSGGTLYAVAHEIKNGKTIAAYEVKIYDDTDNLLATFTGTVYRKGIEVVP